MDNDTPIDPCGFWKLIEPAVRVENVTGFDLRLRFGETPTITLEILPCESQAKEIAAVIRRFRLVELTEEGPDETTPER